LAPPLAFTSRTGYIFKKTARLLKKAGGLLPKRLRAFQIILFVKWLDCFFTERERAKARGWRNHSSSTLAWFRQAQPPYAGAIDSIFKWAFRASIAEITDLRNSSPNWPKDSYSLFYQPKYLLLPASVAPAFRPGSK